MVKPRPVVFPGNARGKLHKLPMIEFVAKPDKQLVWHLDGGVCHHNRVSEHHAFQVREHGARFEFVQCLELVIGQTLLPADRRTDIDSEWATDHHGDFDLGQRLELRRYGLGGLLPQFHMGQRS